MENVTSVGMPDECVRFDPALGIEAFNRFMMRPATPVVTETQGREGSDERLEAPAAE